LEFAIITINANELVAQIHDRMPAIFARSHALAFR
jgi:putative SOS response-associated peptidase YedK